MQGCPPLLGARSCQALQHLPEVTTAQGPGEPQPHLHWGSSTHLYQHLEDRRPAGREARLLRSICRPMLPSSL